VVVSEHHQLLAAANCGPPTASSSIKVYSTAGKSHGELVADLPVNAPSDLVLQVSNERSSIQACKVKSMFPGDVPEYYL
jgi:hypothetical protein